MKLRRACRASSLPSLSPPQLFCGPPLNVKVPTETSREPHAPGGRGRYLRVGGFHRHCCAGAVARTRLCPPEQATSSEGQTLLGGLEVPTIDHTRVHQLESWRAGLPSPGAYSPPDYLLLIACIPVYCRPLRRQAPRCRALELPGQRLLPVRVSSPLVVYLYRSSRSKRDMQTH